MNYYLNLFPFGRLQSESILSNDQRFDQDNFPKDVLQSGIDPDMVHESLIRHSMALQLCEDQLKPFLRQDPFIPDYFGFLQETVDVINDEGDNVGYIAYFNREKDAVLVPNYEKVGHWHLRKTGGEKIVDIIIPNAMIGYFVMASLGYVPFVNERI